MTVPEVPSRTVPSPFASSDVRRWLVPPLLLVAAAIGLLLIPTSYPEVNRDLRNEVVGRVTAIDDADGAPEAWLDLPAHRFEARAVSSLPVAELRDAGAATVRVGTDVTVWQAIDDPTNVSATHDTPVSTWVDEQVYGLVFVAVALIWLAARVLLLVRARRLLMTADRCYRMAAVLDTSRRWTTVDLLPVDPTIDTPPVARLEVLARRGRYTSGVADVEVYGTPGPAQLAVPVLDGVVLWPAGRTAAAVPRLARTPSAWRRVAWALVVPVGVALYLFITLGLHVADVREAEAHSQWTRAEVVLKDDMYLLLRYDVGDGPTVAWLDVEDDTVYRDGQDIRVLVGDLHEHEPWLQLEPYDAVPVVVFWAITLTVLAVVLWMFQNVPGAFRWLLPRGMRHEPRAVPTRSGDPRLR